MTAGLTPEVVLAALDAVKDPEIPVVSVVDLGIVQGVAIEGDRVTVSITPTFTGCPALEVMRQEIAAKVRGLGAVEVTVPVVLDPPWSADRITPAARERMAAIGLAPPPTGRFRGDPDLALSPDAAPGEDLQPPCPFCGEKDTTLQNPFGVTICRALHYCNACRQPFESFKPL